MHKVGCQEIEHVVVGCCGRGARDRRGGWKHGTITPVTEKGGIWTLTRLHKEGGRVYGTQMLKIDMADEIGQGAEDGATICPHAVERRHGGGKGGGGEEVW